MAELADNVLTEIRRIATGELDITFDVEPHHELVRDLQLDSVGALVLAVGLEDRFRVTLSDEDAARVVTVGDLVALVVRRVGEEKA